MDSFSILAAAAEAAHRDGYQIALMVRRSFIDTDSSKFSFIFDGINGKSSQLLKHIFIEIGLASDYAKDFKAYDPNVSISGGDPTAINTSSSEQQSLTQAQLFLELTKLFNVKISVVKTEESNVVSHSNNPNNSTREDKPLTAPTSAQVPTFTPPAHSSDIDVKQKETKQKNKKQKGKLNQPVSEKNIVRTTCDATAAADSVQGLWHAPCSDQQEVSTGYAELDNDTSDGDPIVEPDPIVDNPFAPELPENESKGTNLLPNYKPTPRLAHLPILGITGGKSPYPLRFKCPHCPLIKHCNSAVQAHVRAVHDKVKSHRCTECSFVTSHLSAIGRHIKAVHKKVRGHQCGICQANFKRKSHLVRHTSSIHENARPHLCDECGKSFTELYMLKTHKRYHNEAEDQQLNCTICSFSTIYEKAMRDHVLVKHRNEDTAGLLHNCPECEYITARADNLVTHVDRVHRKLRPHACELCDHKFYTRRELNRHLVKAHDQPVPQGETFHKCNQCEYVALNPSHLKRHVNAMHEKTTMYSCELCSFTSYRKDNLVAHIRARHKK